MPNLLRADLFVLGRSRTVWIALAVAIAMAIGYFTSAHLIATGAYDASVAGAVLGFADALAAPLLGSLLIGVAVAADLENRTVHDRLLAAPRRTLAAVKVVIAELMLGVVLLPYAVGALVCLAAGWDLSVFLTTTPLAVAANPAGEPVTAGTLAAGAGLCLASALVMTAGLGLRIPVAFATRRPLAVTAVGFVGSFLVDALAGMVRRYDAGRALLRLTPWSPELPLTPDSSGGDVALAVGVSVVFLRLWAVAGWLMLRRADIG